MADSGELGLLLRENRGTQARQSEMQAQALELQRERLQAYRTQPDRVERINDRTEALQKRAGRIMHVASWIGVPLRPAIGMIALRSDAPWLRYAYGSVI